MKVKKRRVLKRNIRVGLRVIKLLSRGLLMIIGIISIFNWIFSKPVEKCTYNTSLNSVQTETVITLNVNDEVKEVEETKESIIVNNKDVEESETPIKDEMNYRMTFYYTGDDTNSGNTTASGKSTKDFQINENGWYTYKGKLVVAAASKRLLSWDRYKDSTQPTYDLYDELILNINGLDYEAVVLDVCGACMKDSKIDLFVKDKASGLDTKIKVRKAD